MVHFTKCWTNCWWSVYNLKENGQQIMHASFQRALSQHLTVMNSLPHLLKDWYAAFRGEINANLPTSHQYCLHWEIKDQQVAKDEGTIASPPSFPPFHYLISWKWLQNVPGKPSKAVVPDSKTYSFFFLCHIYFIPFLQKQEQNSIDIYYVSIQLGCWWILLA